MTETATSSAPPTVDPEERIDLLLRDLRSSRSGLSSHEAERRLVQYGPNMLRRRGGRRWPRELARQFTHPLALLLWVAAALAWVAGIIPVALAIVVVIVINAAFAFAQEVQAERAVEALAEYLPPRAKVLRDGREQTVDAAHLVPGDVLVLEEGDRVSADARLLTRTLGSGWNVPPLVDACRVGQERLATDDQDAHQTQHIRFVSTQHGDSRTTKCQRARGVRGSTQRSSHIALRPGLNHVTPRRFGQPDPQLHKCTCVIARPDPQLCGFSRFCAELSTIMLPSTRKRHDGADSVG